jgi:uncharacterized protein
MSRHRRAGVRSNLGVLWRLAATIVLAVVVAFVAYSFSETYRLQVKEYAFVSPDVPAAFDGTRIVLLTDIHRAFFFSEKRLAGVVRRVASLDPDLIVLGGDYVYGSKDYEAPTFAELSHLEAPLGVFAALGNHDYAHPTDGESDRTPALLAADKANIPLLDNTGAWIEKSGQRFRLAGVSDLQEGFPNAWAAIAGATPNDLVVLVAHEPDFAESLAPGEVDLMLAGHTHGGQLTLFGLWAPLVGSHYGQKYRTGMVSAANTTVVVSNGIGTIFPPLRFFARPQIVVVTLRSSDRTSISPRSP